MCRAESWVSLGCKWVGKGEGVEATGCGLRGTKGGIDGYEVRLLWVEGGGRVDGT